MNLQSITANITTRNKNVKTCNLTVTTPTALGQVKKRGRLQMLRKGKQWRLPLVAPVVLLLLQIHEVS